MALLRKTISSLTKISHVRHKTSQFHKTLCYMVDMYKAQKEAQKAEHETPKAERQREKTDRERALNRPITCNDVNRAYK